MYNIVNLVRSKPFCTETIPVWRLQLLKRRKGVTDELYLTQLNKTWIPLCQAAIVKRMLVAYNILFEKSDGDREWDVMLAMGHENLTQAESFKRNLPALMPEPHLLGLTHMADCEIIDDFTLYYDLAYRNS